MKDRSRLGGEWRHGQRADVDSIAAGSLGAVEGLVGLVDELFGGNVIAVDGYAEAAGDIEGAGGGVDGRIGDDGAKLIGTDESVGE